MKPSAKTAKFGREHERSHREHFSIKSVNSRFKKRSLSGSTYPAVTKSGGVPMVYDLSLTASRSYVICAAQASLED